MSEVADRIAYLMKRGKLKSLAAASRAYGIGYEVFKKIASHSASETRNLTAEQAIQIARYHKVSPGWVMFGDGKPAGMGEIPLLGKIGAGQEMMIFETPGNEDSIPTELSVPGASAFEADGDSMIPLARHGDIVIVGPAIQDVTSLIGEECGVLLEDGRRFFKIIERGSKSGRYNLVSHNAATIRDVEIHSAGPLIAVRRRRRATSRRTHRH
jgi:hypothetical protein